MNYSNNYNEKNSNASGTLVLRENIGLLCEKHYTTTYSREELEQLLKKQNIHKPTQKVKV